jgi:glycosyltransferase involved in cell wall biosynthesis
VCLILEGTYPYVRGGVSSWVHQIIKGLPELSFSLVFIGGAPDRYQGRSYELPPNVVHLEELFLAAPPPAELVEYVPGDPDLFAASHALHEAFRRGVPADDQVLARVVRFLVEAPGRCQRDFLHSERAWREIVRRYESSAPTRSFLEYFWTIRSMHAPLFSLARAAARLPTASVYHVISTGFAGFLAMLLRRRRGRPLLLTEHGIYTKERRIEVLQAQWIFDDDRLGPDADEVGVGVFRQLWIRFFEQLGRMTYEAADAIVALYEGNRARQIADGAPPERTLVLPNGIAVERFARLRAQRPAVPPMVFALIGRVVPIKDIKTFLRAARLVCSEVPEAEAWIVGPEDEDPPYAEECHELVVSLGLERQVGFLGFKRMEEVLPRIGLNVLTSISEAQPLVVLEGFAAGIPAVATDVGCCRELIEGRTPADRALGHAGAVVGIADPEATARAILGLLRDPARWSAAQRAAIARVEQSYTEPLMLDRYRALYRGMREE